MAQGGIEGLLGTLELEEISPGHYVAQNFLLGTGEVVFGGQILAQVLIAADRMDAQKSVKSMHTTFSRGANLRLPLEIEVEPVHSGRTVGTATVTVRQESRVCARSQVLLNLDESDFLRYTPPPKTRQDPMDAVASAHGEGFWEIRTVDGVDITDPAAIGPPTLEVWSRFPGGPFSAVVSQALLAYASDGFLIGTAMRPHPGVGQALAHVTVATTVITQSLTFLEPFDAAQWLLLAHESPHAGHGRSFGRADVFTESGLLVASFTQENMIRAM